MTQFYGYKIKSLEEIEKTATVNKGDRLDNPDWDVYFMFDTMGPTCGEVYASDEIDWREDGCIAIGSNRYIPEWFDKVYVTDGRDFDFQANEGSIVKIEIKSTSEIENLCDVNEGDRINVGPRFIEEMWKDCGKVLNFNELTETRGYIRCVNHIWTLHPDWVYVYHISDTRVVEDVESPAEPLVEYEATPEEFRTIKGTLGDRVTIIGYKTLPFQMIAPTLNMNRRHSGGTNFPEAMDSLCELTFFGDESSYPHEDRVKLGGFFWIDSWYTVLFTVA